METIQLKSKSTSEPQILNVLLYAVVVVVVVVNPDFGLRQHAFLQQEERGTSLKTGRAKLNRMNSKNMV